MLSYVQNGDITSFMKQMQIESTEFFSPDDYKKYLESKIGTDMSNIIIEERGTETKIVDSKHFENHTYLVYSKGTDGVLFTVVSNNSEDSNGEKQFSCKQEGINFSSMIIQAPAHAKVLANGIPIADKYIIDTNIIDGFSTISNRKDLPKNNIYKLERFIERPTISVENQDDTKFAHTTNKNSSDIKIIIDVDSKTKADIELFGIKSAKAYAMFISRDIERNEFTKYASHDSDFYKSLMNFDNSWFSVHSSFEFQNVSASNISAYSDKYFSCDVSFNYVIKQNRTSKTYNMSYKIMIEHVNNEYKIVNLINI